MLAQRSLLFGKNGLGGQRRDGKHGHEHNIIESCTFHCTHSTQLHESTNEGMMNTSAHRYIYANHSTVIFRISETVTETLVLR